MNPDASRAGRRGRSITLDPKTVENLRQHLGTQLEEERLLGDAYTDHGLVFCHEDGKPLHPDSVTKRFSQLVRDSALPVIKFHGLRHTHSLPVCGFWSARRWFRSGWGTRRSK